MKWIHLILLLFLWVPVQAQSNLDSLWSLWSDKELHDTIRLDALSNYTLSEAQFSHPDSALTAAILILEYSRQTDQLFYQAKAYDHLGRIEGRKRNFPKALQYENKALKLFQDLNDNYEIAILYWDIGVTFLNMGYHSKSLEYHLKSLDLHEALDKSTDGILNNIGLIYKNLKDDGKAMVFFQRSVQAAKKRGYENDIALTNIGDLFLRQGNPTKALELYNIRKIREENDKDGYYNSSMCYILMKIAKAHVELNNFDLALENYLLSLEYSRKDSIAKGTSFDWELESELGKYYILTGNMDSAIYWCSKGLKKAKKARSIKYQSKACQCLYAAFKKKEDNTNALKYYENYQMLNDSLKLEESAKSIQQIEFAKQILVDSLKQAEENQRIELLHNNEVLKKDKTRNILISLGSIFFLLVIGLYSRNRYVNRVKNLIEEEKKRSDNLLLNILPAEIAEELKDKGEAAARNFELVSVLFTDFKGFTQASAKLSAADLVDEINTCFKAFDIIVDKYGIEKIKTIGDAYMAAGGLPIMTNDSVKNTVLAAVEMQEFIEKRKINQDLKGLPAFEMRAGIHTGPVVAGIVGFNKYQYDIWGDTVNTASRMESNGNIGKVNISQATYEHLKDANEFTFESRGKIDTKGKGEIEMWFVQKVNRSNKNIT